MRPEASAGTRERILFFLKTRGPLAASDMARQLEVTPMAVRQWFLHHKAKHDGGDSRVLNEGSATVAGMTGYFAIYERTSKIKGQPLQTITKDWYFGKRDGRCGILRCICRSRSFLHWQAIFDTVRAKLEDKPG